MNIVRMKFFRSELQIQRIISLHISRIYGAKTCNALSAYLFCASIKGNWDIEKWFKNYLPQYGLSPIIVLTWCKANGFDNDCFKLWWINRSDFVGLSTIFYRNYRRWVDLNGFKHCWHDHYGRSHRCDSSNDGSFKKQVHLFDRCTCFSYY